MWLRTEIRKIEERLLVLAINFMLWRSGLRRRTAGQVGQSMVEYAIVVALVAIIAMAGVQAFGEGVQQVFQHLLSKIQSIGS
jgi:Flp pilus assembly pilin Flp